jgi:hypothetical protein
LRGHHDDATIVDLAASVARRHGAAVVRSSANRLSIVNSSGSVMAELCWRAPDTTDLASVSNSSHSRRAVELHAVSHVEETSTLFEDLTRHLRHSLLPFTQAELADIRRSMPLVQRVVSHEPELARWALVFRDHFLEHSVGFVDGMLQSGVDAEWLYALAKGDRTRNRERIHATFLSLNCRSGIMDNAWIPDSYGDVARTDPVLKELDAFIESAHAAGRRVMAVDDGGLIALGYGSAGGSTRVDAAIELTVSGLKRIRRAPGITIPVVNMARSTLKTLLGYPEIADSCIRRLRDLLPVQKFAGRPVLLIGYGALGARLAPRLRSLGVRLSVVDEDLLALIAAAESGFCTFRFTRDALVTDPPFLIVSTTGEPVLDRPLLECLPVGVFLAPFATKDFSTCNEPDLLQRSQFVPGFGRRYQLENGADFVVLGDGRSLNLFESDSIPNGGYDAYRAGTILAAKRLALSVDTLAPGIDDYFADEAIAASDLFEAYYEFYLALKPACTRDER